MKASLYKRIVSSALYRELAAVFPKVTGLSLKMSPRSPCLARFKTTRPGNSWPNRN